MDVKLVFMFESLSVSVFSAFSRLSFLWPFPRIINCSVQQIRHFSISTRLHALHHVVISAPSPANPSLPSQKRRCTASWELWPARLTATPLSTWSGSRRWPSSSPRSWTSLCASTSWKYERSSLWPTPRVVFQPFPLLLPWKQLRLSSAQV